MTKKEKDRGVSRLMMGFLALLVGLLAGFGAILFRLLIGFIHNLLFLGKFNCIYDANIHTSINPWGIGIIFVPVVGAILVAFLVKNFAPEAKGHGVPEVLDAIYLKKGQMRPIVAAIKSLASALSIGSGGSVGREGPIVQIGSVFGATLARFFYVPSWQRGILIAAGAAGGIAATFNTPIGALLFSVELLLASISAATLFPVAISTVTATYIGRWYFGNFPAFYVPALTLPHFQLFPWSELILFIPFGFLVGLLSVSFIHGIYWFEDTFDKIPGNYYLRHMLGMFIVGSLIYFMMYYSGHYYVEGVGYATILDILRGILRHPGFLLILLCGKWLATCLTLGSGASGGIFSPSLFLGATMGAVFGLFLNYLIPGLHTDPIVFAIVGMASMVGSTTGAVLTGIIMITEMTGDVNVVLPIIISVAIAYAVRKAISHDNIYTLKLARRGAAVSEGLQAAVFLAQRAQQVMNKTFRTVDLDELIKNLELYKNNPWQNLVTIVSKDNKPMGIWRYPIAQRENESDPVRLYLDEKIMSASINMTLPEILRQTQMLDAHYTLVFKTMRSRKVSDIVGVIGEREILNYTLNASYLFT